MLSLIFILSSLTLARADFPDCLNGPLKSNLICDPTANYLDRATALVDLFTLEELAVSPNLPGQVPRLLEEIASSGNQYLAADGEARLGLLEAARSLVYALETPREAIIRHCWSDVRPPSHFACYLCYPSNI